MGRPFSELRDRMAPERVDRNEAIAKTTLPPDLAKAEDNFRRKYGRPKKIREAKPWPFCQHLGVLFIGLKLAHVITWSWAFVVAPVILDIVMVALVNRHIRSVQRVLGFKPSDF